jgi:hypothetical protein
MILCLSNIIVIASEAKQSSGSRSAGLLRSLSLLAMTIVLRLSIDMLRLV